MTKRIPDTHGNNVIKNKKEEGTMKKVRQYRTTSRIVSFMLAAMMLLMPLAGCMNNQEQKYEFLDTVNQTTSATTTQKVENPDTGALAGEKDSAENNSDIQKQLDEALAKLETLEKEKAEAEKKAAEAIEGSKKAEAEVTKLEAENASLKEQVAPAVEVINGTVYCDVEYFLERATVIFDDGTAALKAIDNGTAVVLDDVHALDDKGNYRDNTFSLPRDGYKIAVTFDGKSVVVADFGNYHWASGSLFLKNNATTGYKLVETEKKGSMGNFAQLLKAVAVCVPNADSEFGYDFYVAAGYHSANPTAKPNQPTQPSNPSKPSNPEKETVTITVTETKLVCKICGKEDCAGHCGKCHAPIPYCSCKPDTVIIVKCPICGLEGCNGHKETVYVPGETIFVPVPGETVVIPGGTIEICHKCKKPIEDCTCKDPANNSTNEGKNDLIDGILDTTPENNSTNPGFQGLADEMKELYGSNQNDVWLPNNSSGNANSESNESNNSTEEWIPNTSVNEGAVSGNNQNTGSTSNEVESGNASSTNNGWNSNENESKNDDTWNPNANASSNSGFGELVESLK